MRPLSRRHWRPPLRVLIVDGCPGDRAALGRLLGIWGHPVCEAADADEALRLVPSVRPDVALVDVALPGRNGRGGVAVVALTGPSVAEKLERAFQIGARCYLAKPVDPALLGSILGAIGERDGR